MRTISDDIESPLVDIVDVTSADSSLLAEVIALGDQNRRTLGFFPQQAFEQAAASGTLLAAICDGHVVAYALYALPRQIVRLTHLCVSQNVRGLGLARRLV